MIMDSTVEQYSTIQNSVEQYSKSNKKKTKNEENKKVRQYSRK